MAVRIHDVIAAHGLAAGDPMRRADGSEVEHSAVVDDRTFLHRDDELGGCRLVRQHVLTGHGTNEWLSPSAMAAIRASTI